MLDRMGDAEPATLETDNGIHLPYPAAATAVTPAKLLVVCNDYDYFVRHRVPVFDELARRGHRVIVYCGGRPAEAGRHPALEFRYLHCERFRFSPGRDFVFAVRLFRALMRERPDVLHTITIKPNLFGGLAVLAARLVSGRPRRFVMMNPGLGRLFAERGGGARAAFVRRLAKLAFRAALAFPSSQAVFENHGDRRRWVEAGLLPRRRSHVLPGAGIDTGHFAPPAGRPPAPPARVLFASRMLRAKGIGVLIAAAEHLAREGVPIEFAIAGEVDPGDPDHYPVDALRLPANARYLGNLEDVREALRSAHVVCLPTSYGEGLPRILLEAAAMGCALVASDQAACRPIVREGRTGHLVPLRDGSVDPEELAGVLRRLAEHPGEAESLGRNARKLVLSGGFGQADVNRRYAAIILGSD
jgi:glycosyltransferase involved in cell wall biosynthesis